jgi:ribosomal-protein-alanine N-acetyltransferase
MIKGIEFRLATIKDAAQMANMSRDLVEAGLGWSWTAGRIKQQIRCPSTVALVARRSRSIGGFAIMHFLKHEAHLNLLAVCPSCQRTGIGRRLVQWLEKSAGVAGIGHIHLEVRAKNCTAQAFYRALGYEEVKLIPRYYNGRETAIRMVHNLRKNDWLTQGERVLNVPWGIMVISAKNVPD